MPYVWLANGDVKQLDAKGMTAAFGDETPRVFRDNGTEHVVVGVYADEVEYDASIDAENQQIADDKAEFEAWKAERDATPKDGEKE